MSKKLTILQIHYGILNRFSYVYLIWLHTTFKMSIFQLKIFSAPPTISGNDQEFALPLAAINSGDDNVEL